MKALLCPNCGGVEFRELDGKRKCIFCNTEFEMDSRDVKDLDDDTIYCPDPDRFGCFIKIARISRPGVSARDWVHQTRPLLRGYQ